MDDGLDTRVNERQGGAYLRGLLAASAAVGPGSKKARPYGTYNPPKSKSKHPNHRKAQKAARKRQRGAK